MEIKVKQILKLQDTVVVRKTPMSNSGCIMLRAIREYLQNVHSKKLDEDVEIPFPTVIHLMMEDYCKIKDIDLSEVNTLKKSSKKKKSQKSSVQENDAKNPTEHEVPIEKPQPTKDFPGAVRPRTRGHSSTSKKYIEPAINSYIPNHWRNGY